MDMEANQTGTRPVFRNKGEHFTVIEFQAWPKTSRFFRDIVITEKIDGSNMAVGIELVDPREGAGEDPNATAYVSTDAGLMAVYAQSRNKIVTPGKQTDHMGFAGWVDSNAGLLYSYLGEGLHFGEWWGSGIQRGYGLEKGEKRFSLFNTHRFSDIQAVSNDLVRCVPILYQGPMVEKEITSALDHLQGFGSWANHGFMNPEGICIYHTSSRLVQKVTLDNNDAGKWEHL
jgi:hypothetical protein